MNGISMKISLAVLAMGVATAWAGEKEIPIEKLPGPVMAAAKTACPDGVIKEASKEKEDGVVAYELEMMVGATSCDLKIARDGTLLEKEQEVAVEDLPKKVANTLKRFADIEVKKAEFVKEMDEEAFYELDVEINDQAFELKISEQGKILEIESKGKKNDDDEENGNDDDDEEHEDESDDD